MTTIKSAKFLNSAVSFDDYKGFDLPEIVLVGRSNVGKSSIINMITNNSRLAKVSSVQGKTKLVNFFLVNKEFVLVDLPGYGYAKTSKLEQQRWSCMINSYFAKAKNLKSACLLVDARHTPTEQDIQMFEYFIYNNIPVTIVATKYDKVKKSERTHCLNTIATTFNVGIQNIYATSSVDSFGKEALIDRLYQFIGEN